MVTEFGSCGWMMGFGGFGLLYAALYPLILIGVFVIIILVIMKLWQQVNQRKR